MADRFPSLDELDAGASHEVSQSTGNQPSVDDFLAREKALLGDDANQFVTQQDSLALGNDLGTGDNGDNDDETKAFEQQFPDLMSSAPHQQQPHGAGPSVTYNSGYLTSGDGVEEESVAIKEWRERRDAANAKRREKHEAQKKETIAEAQRNIDEFYENYNSKKEKQIAQTRKDADEFLKNREDTVSGGTSWERIAKLVDLTGKGAKGGGSGSQKERFRKLLISLKNDEKSPGIEGH